MSYQALLFCPDDKTARVVTQVLTELDFTVEPCNEPFGAVKKLMAKHFDAIVVDCDNEQNAALIFKSARNSGSNQNSLAVAVVEGQAGVAKAFRIGANLVLTKPINVEQSKGTLRVARGLLRKSDIGKPTTAAGEATPQPAVRTPEAARPAAPVRPLAAAFTPPMPPAPQKPPVAKSGFELQPDTSPRPEAAEAALLESMPDPTAKPISSSATPKEYPWQPVSKLAEPMASALRIAAETAAKPSSGESGTATQVLPWGSEPAKDNSHSSLGGRTAGAATAPAKQSPKSVPSTGPEESSPTQPDAGRRQSHTIPTQAPQFEPPTFAALAVKDHEEDENEGSGKKAYVILALVALATIFTAYVAFQKMHSNQEPSTAPVTQAAPAVPAASGDSAADSAASTSAAPATTPPQEITLTTPKPSEPASKKPAPGVASSKSYSDVTVTKFPAGAQDAAPPAKPADETHEPPAIVVKKNSAHPAPKSGEADLAPPPTMAAPSDEKALSGIVAVTPAAVARPVPTTLKVSQGVSQGLLVKRVQPIYPPQALQMRIEGTVVLEASITKDGRIANVQVVKGEGILAKAAADAVKQWKYNPYFLNGEPVEIQTQISIKFKLP
ncbi:MAG TPA: TonB family protein [Terriglobales bacterium]|nr:TonB family protein [Terriglobales bacterium]